MISASKTTFSHYNLNILRPKVTKNIKNLRKKFCEFRPRRQCYNINLDLKTTKVALNSSTLHYLNSDCNNIIV
jgi:hypothetical protein